LAGAASANEGRSAIIGTDTLTANAAIDSSRLLVVAAKEAAAGRNQCQSQAQQESSEIALPVVVSLMHVSNPPLAAPPALQF
jgi:hypothetical protein